MGQHLLTVGALHIAIHLCVFCVLGTLLAASFGGAGLGVRILALGFGIALGASTELYEHLAFANEMEYVDVVTNIFGFILGFAAGEIFQRRTRG
jgi:hypothetical protein